MHAFRFNSKDAGAAIDLLPPDRAPRAMPKAANARRIDVIDAEFEVVSTLARRGPYPVFNDNSRDRLRPSVNTSPRTSQAFRLLSGIESVLQSVSPKAFAALVAAVSTVIFLILVGLPGGAAAVPAAPLVLSELRTTVSEQNGMKILSVYGTVKNRSGATKSVPAILVDVIADGKRVTASRVLPAEALAAGETRPFSTRLLHTGGKRPEVAVSFSQTDAPTP